MLTNIEIITAAVSLIVKSALLAAQWSGRARIRGLLNVFISASTVRNILKRSKPRKGSPFGSIGKEGEGKKKFRKIPARYPNHLWSVDKTRVLIWCLWQIQVLVAIDHFSRKILFATPLKGANAFWAIQVLERAFEKFGSPKHMITDQESIFTCDAFADFLDHWNVKPRFGAVGEHASISVTERAIKTIKYEGLKRVSIIRGFNHLTKLCFRFSIWYNEWRPHMTIDGARPDDVYYGNIPTKPERTAKFVPLHIERRGFKEVRITGYRLKKAA